MGIPSPVAEVNCSTYATIAITVDGQCFSWGDCDGHALGHQKASCHRPHPISALRGLHVAHGSLSYTNGAVATSTGRVYLWGGNSWEGGLAQGRPTPDPTEMHWAGAPPGYKCVDVAVAYKHGALVFQLDDAE